MNTEVETLPDLYGLVMKGDCPEAPAIKDGSVVAVSKVERYTADDLVIVWFRPDCIPAGSMQARLRRVVLMPPPFVRFPYRVAPASEAIPVIGFAVNDPTKYQAITCDRILAVHKCLGPVPHNQQTEG